MSTAQRAGLLVGTAVVLVAAFVLSRPDEPPRRTSTTQQTTQQTTQTAPAAAPAPRAAPDRGPLLTRRGVRTIDVRRGDEVRFRVRSATREELHVHGYDISRPLPPGRTVAVRFAARIEGVFEIELEGSGVQIAELRVRP
jgi:FtsP/CotA-like multicopper oxidase with cupredoxin domain